MLLFLKGMVVLLIAGKGPGSWGGCRASEPSMATCRELLAACCSGTDAVNDPLCVCVCVCACSKGRRVAADAS